MNNYQEKRKEKRLNYDWPISFCREFDKYFLQGKILNISSTHIAFSCQTKHCPAGDGIAVLRFNVPKFSSDGNFQKKEFTYIGSVSSVRLPNPFTRLVVIALESPIPFKPGEQDVNTQTNAGAGNS